MRLLLLLLLSATFASASAAAPQKGSYVPAQKFAEWKPRGFGSATANFPKDDPTGSKRALRAKVLKKMWKQRKAAADKAGLRLAGFPSWDLSNVNGKNYITSVKDQGSCGTCVAFSSLAALETSIMYKMGSSFPVSAYLSNLINLSEQHLYYCVGGRYCNSGWSIQGGALTVESFGSMDERCMPYSDYWLYQKCMSTSCGVPQTWGKNGTIGIKAVSLNDWDAIKYHIVNHGPISTGITIYSDFPGFADAAFVRFGSSYVWPGSKTKKVLGGHAIMCYGYDDNADVGDGSGNKGVLFCKNSWGTRWGNYGFFKVAYGADGVASGWHDVYGFIVTPSTGDVPVAAPTPTKTATRTQTATSTSATATRTATSTASATKTSTPTPAAFTPVGPIATTQTKTKSRTVTRTSTVAGPILGRTATQCQDYILSLSCGSNLFIKITSAFYGRDDQTTCLRRGWNTSTMCGGDKTIAFKACNGVRSCYGYINDRTMGASGCPWNTVKFARVTYDCLPASAFK